MYQPSTPPPAWPHYGRTAMIYGLSAGTVLGLTQCLFYIYTRYAQYSTLSELSGPFYLLVFIGGFLLIGFLAGKRLGKTSAGTLVGLWAGISAGIILAVLTFLSFISASLEYSSYGLSGFITLYASLSIISVIFWMAIGTGLGALGGLIGQSFFVPTMATVYPYRQSDPPQAERVEES